MQLSFLEHKIYKLFLENPSRTDYELEIESGINPNSIRPVRKKLENKGLIRRTLARRRAGDRGFYTIYVLSNYIPEHKIDAQNRRNYVSFGKAVTTNGYLQHQRMMERLLSKALRKINGRST